MPAGYGYSYLGYGIGPYGGDPIGSLGVDYYLNLITSQYQNSPNFLALLQALLQMLEDVATCALTMPDAFDIDLAAGVQLDILGQIVGASRTLPFQPTGGLSATLADSDYRTLLRARIALNQWNGEVDGLQPIWESLFPGGTIYIDDGQNMSATVVLAGAFSAIAQQMIQNGMIVPRPAGVEYTITFATLPLFGFDLNTSYVAGFDTGKFA